MPPCLTFYFLPHFRPVPYADCTGYWPSSLGAVRTFAVHLLLYLLLIFPSCSVRMSIFVWPILFYLRKA